MAVTNNEFTDREREIMRMAWGCMETEPKVRLPLPSLTHHLLLQKLHHKSNVTCQVDYKKLASLAGMTNHVSASNAWARIKKKMQAQAGEAVAAGGDATPKTATKKRAKASEGEDGGEGGKEGGSPTKKARTPKAKVKKEVLEEATGEEDGEEGGEESML